MEFLWVIVSLNIASPSKPHAPSHFYFPPLAPCAEPAQALTVTAVSSILALVSQPDLSTFWCNMHPTYSRLECKQPLVSARNRIWDLWSGVCIVSCAGVKRAALQLPVQVSNGMWYVGRSSACTYQLYGVLGPILTPGRILFIGWIPGKSFEWWVVLCWIGLGRTVGAFRPGGMLGVVV